MTLTYQEIQRPAPQSTLRSRPNPQAPFDTFPHPSYNPQMFAKCMAQHLCHISQMYKLGKLCINAPQSAVATTCVLHLTQDFQRLQRSPSATVMHTKAGQICLQVQHLVRPIAVGQADDERRDGSSKAVTCSWRSTILMPIRPNWDETLPELRKFVTGFRLT